MTRTDPSKNQSDLRQRAEERVTQEVQKAVSTSPEDVRRLLHELSVHQIELELQNEEMRSAQTELEASRRKYIDLYEFSPVGLLLLDDEGRIQEPNFTFTQLIGVTRQKLSNRDFTAFVDPASQNVFHFFFQKLRSTHQPQQCELVLRPPDRAPLPVRLDAVVAQAAPPAKYRLSITDLTLQKQVEAQALQLSAEQQRIKVLSDFVRNLSHNIRIPLTTITTGLYLVGKLQDKEAQLQKIEEINGQVFALNAVLDQLQQMAVLDNMTSLEPTVENLNRLVEEVIQAFKPRAAARKVKLVSQLDSTVPTIPLDLTHMDRALKHLIENALRFTPHGGTITVTTARKEDAIQIEVADTGVGIDDDVLPHIFERFYRAPIAGQPANGTGLGLSLAQRIVEMHNGTIEAQSTPGVRTVFTITLPIR